MKKGIILSLFFLMNCMLFAQSPQQHDLNFNALADTWDRAIPLGNGMIGALIWQKDNHLRFSLDRADLWDLRPMKGLHRKEFSYHWVYEQVQKKDYGIVQNYFDAPYDREPAPSKIPGGALEFDTQNWGNVQSVHLHLQNALCEVKWQNGIRLKTFVHATKPVGWFRLENISKETKIQLIAPKYQGEIKVSGDPVGGDDLARLGYKQGKILQQNNCITYQQEGWGGFTYEICVRWKKVDASTIEGVWSISSQYPHKKVNPTASAVTLKAISNRYISNFNTHEVWWKNFWNKSAIQIPDKLIERQWYLEQYKFGSASRKGAPPISLQAVWTADNGRIPPWKGDFHHDLNTQLSYWPCYSGNHLEEGIAYIDHLESNKANYKRYTKMYFGTDGLAVPGVTTLTGDEMGGWIQYSLSPSISAWLAHHYYLQWRYSMDRDFLKNKAYPWVKDVAVFLEALTVKDGSGHRKLPISSSPEINDNDIRAWFPQNTNFDLSLMKFAFQTASELAEELGLKSESVHWKKILAEFGDYSLTKNDELMISPTMPYNQSHRHFSNMMAIYPLSLLKWEDGIKSQTIIRNSIHLLDSIGPANWCGYSYSWLANLKARAKDGDGAAKSLEIFAKAFCSENSFHLNGDQTKSGYSTFTYSPFTLEGNFACAAGLQEMLLQSYAGFIEIMPAVPTSWKDISFQKLRAEGAFLISARKAKGQIEEVVISSEKGGSTILKIPFKTSWKVESKDNANIKQMDDNFLRLSFKAGGKIILKNASEY
ncbi:MAG: glycoside hydrolase N-terminal domain-containing protein [Bacteroidota bacterium]|nr:glycoside hydrolase N-terminal domain-containing protein [Bacteroidota bacterium]